MPEHVSGYREYQMRRLKPLSLALISLNCKPKRLLCKQLAHVFKRLELQRIAARV